MSMLGEKNVISGDAKIVRYLNRTAILHLIRVQ